MSQYLKGKWHAVDRASNFLDSASRVQQPKTLRLINALVGIGYAILALSLPGEDDGEF